jgi:hypothetical protein
VFYVASNTRVVLGAEDLGAVRDAMD